MNSCHHYIAPGPRLSVWRALFGMQRDVLSFYLDAARQYGPVVRFQLGRWFWHFVSHPDGVKHVLQDNHSNYGRQSRFNNLLKLGGGEGLLTSDGKLWRRQRRLVQPAFHHQRITEFATIMTDMTAAMLDCWQLYIKTGRPLDVTAEMGRLTLGIVGKALFNVTIGKEAEAIGRAVSIALDHVHYRATHLLSLPECIPTVRNRRFRKAICTVDKIIYRVIQERRENKTDMRDVLSMLLDARDEATGESMSDKQIRDEIVAFLGAGHETTANALAWTWFLLSQHAAVEQQLHSELATVLTGRLPTVHDLPCLPYTKMVIEEALRLYPPAWALNRVTIKADEIGGYYIPAQSLVLLSPYVTHRSPVFWEHPEEFDPEHFRPERTTKRPRYAYFPFGGGPHQCIGNEFAMMELQLIVAMVAQRYRLRLVPGHTVEPKAAATLRPHSGILMTLNDNRGRNNHELGG